MKHVGTAWSLTALLFGILFLLLNCIGCIQYGLTYFNAHMLGFLISGSIILASITNLIKDCVNKYID